MHTMDLFEMGRVYSRLDRGKGHPETFENQLGTDKAE
jgi:hypothetical protein